MMTDPVNCARRLLDLLAGHTLPYLTLTARPVWVWLGARVLLACVALIGPRGHQSSVPSNTTREDIPCPSTPMSVAPCAAAVGTSTPTPSVPSTAPPSNGRPTPRRCGTPRRSRSAAAMDGIIHGRQGLLSGEESHA